MKKKIVYSLEQDERAMQGFIMDACNLAGMAFLQSNDPVRASIHNIQQNQFTDADVARVQAWLQSRERELQRSAEEDDCPVPELPGRSISTEQVWRDGLNMQSKLIREKRDAFWDFYHQALTTWETQH